MTEDQIKHMVDRFLSWKLPENFNPDGGVNFKRLENRHHHPEASPFYPMPTGTNLLDAMQATELVRHMIEGMPHLPCSAGTVREALEKARAYIEYSLDTHGNDIAGNGLAALNALDKALTEAVPQSPRSFAANKLDEMRQLAEYLEQYRLSDPHIGPDDCDLIVAALSTLSSPAPQRAPEQKDKT